MYLFRIMGHYCYVLKNWIIYFWGHIDIVCDVFKYLLILDSIYGTEMRKSRFSSIVKYIIFPGKKGTIVGMVPLCTWNYSVTAKYTCHILTGKLQYLKVASPFVYPKHFLLLRYAQWGLEGALLGPGKKNVPLTLCSSWHVRSLSSYNTQPALLCHDPLLQAQDLLYKKGVMNGQLKECERVHVHQAFFTNWQHRFPGKRSVSFVFKRDYHQGSPRDRWLQKFFFIGISAGKSQISGKGQI